MTKKAKVLDFHKLSQKTDSTEKTGLTTFFTLDEKKKVYEMAARSILKALDIKDNYTYGHSLRVAHYALILAAHMNFTEEKLYELELSALFHDIGKIGIPDNVLGKPSRLTEDEFQIMKRHPELSYQILKDFEGFEDIAKNARHHHERYDGKGYPDKLKGEDIPIASRMILIADTYDAITSSRVYRKGLSIDVAFEELEEYAGTQFDPNLVKNFISAMKEYNNKSSEKTYITLIRNLDQLKEKDKKKAA